MTCLSPLSCFDASALALSLPSVSTLTSLLLLALGFGFVIFWHELGHFLAAKWAGVKVEQFAVGFGQAMLAWRKGLGLRIGTTAKEFRRRLDAHLDAADAAAGSGPAPADAPPERTEMDYARAAEALGISETEYRLNWIPLGGYVKMMGQDDLKPNSEAEDPRAFNRQSIGKRMVIVSAGVVMNVILAAVLFMALFMIGFHVPPAKVGSIEPGSPYQKAGGAVGDEIITIDGKRQDHDWTKVQLSAALSDPDEPTPIVVERKVDGEPGRLTLMVQPQRGSGPTKEILGMGISAAYELKAPGNKQAVARYEQELAKAANLLDPEMLALKPGDQVVAVDGRSIDVNDFVAFDQMMQASMGRPMELTVRGVDGAERNVTVHPSFMAPYGDGQLSFAGMLPRVQVSVVRSDSPAMGHLRPGDVLTAITTGKDRNTKLHPTFPEFKKRLNESGQSDGPFDLEFLRDGEEWYVHNLRTVKVDPHTSGLSIGIGYEEGKAVVADTLDESAARKANIPSGAEITRVAGEPTANWNDFHRASIAWLKAHPAAAGVDPAPMPIAYQTPGGQAISTSLPLSAAEAEAIESYRFALPLPFEQPRDALRKTSNPLRAALMGVTETRDFILQFYLTLRRMVTGDVSAKNMMGPVGIFQAGTTFASRGGDWLIWFLAMISANLAVVNFLPIPIVDGGLFTFLILEKIKGKPISPRTQAIAQYVGMALLLGIFLFVTWQDVQWFQFRM